jgi:SurA N-terminal domain
VMPVRMQVGRVAVIVAVAGAVLSGCGDQPGTAVVVGGQAVPVDQVQGQLDTALAKHDRVAQWTAQGGTSADLARSFVTREVLHDLLARRAAQEGITVTDADVDAQLAQSGGADAVADQSWYDVAGLRTLVRDNLLAAQLAQRHVGGLAVTLDMVAATSQGDAEAKARTLAAGGPAAEALFDDPRTAVRGTAVHAASVPDDAASVYFGAPVGSVVAFQPSPQQSTWIVFRVVDRRTDAPADPAAMNSISQSQLAAIGVRLLQPTADELGVRVNPRYGVWDPIQMRVVAEDAQSGLIIPPAPSPAS